MNLDETISKIYQRYDKLDSERQNCLAAAQNLAEKIMARDDLHGIGHIYRVVINCHRILQHEAANPFITLMAAWLHDLGRAREDDSRNHAVVSAEMAGPFLESLNEGMDSEVLDKALQLRILLCIESHSFSSGKVQNSIEAKVLSDADKIDAIGHIGIYRAACYQHDHGTGIDGMIRHFHEKLLILHRKLNTTTGKAIGAERTNIIERYLRGLNSELMNG